MRKIIKYYTILMCLGSTILLFIFCTNKKYSDHHKCVSLFRESFKSLDSNQVIDFRKNVDCFDWDTLMVIIPQFSKDYIEKKTKITLPSGMSYDFFLDGEGRYWYILFIKNNIVADYLFIPKTEISLNPIAYGHDQFRFIKKGNAVFSTFYETADDKRYYVFSTRKIVYAKLLSDSTEGSIH